LLLRGLFCRKCAMASDVPCGKSIEVYRYEYHRFPCLHRLCDWLCYCPRDRCQGCGCYRGAACCTPPLYTFFLCDGCGCGATAPVPCGCQTCPPSPTNLDK
jgi:hypothetical protein